MKNKSQNKIDKSEKVGIVRDNVIVLGIDHSPLTGRDICKASDCVIIYIYNLRYYCILFYNAIQYWSADNCHYLQQVVNIAENHTILTV